MGAISLTNNSIYSQKINNFSGELFRVGGQRTPFLSATGGLNGGKVLQSTFWQIQAADSAVVSSEPTKAQEGAQPTEYLGRDRVAYTGVTQIFHKGIKMTYTAMATYQHQNPFDLSANIANSSDGDGTVTAADKLALSGSNPIVDEFAEQMSMALEKVAREVEWFAFNGTFADGANTTPGAGTREMRGLNEYCALNANADNDTAPTFVGGNVHYCDANGDGSGADKVLSWDSISEGLKRYLALRAAFSLTHSAIMFFAPAIASASLSISPLTNLLAILKGLSPFWDMIIFAKGSRPIFFAFSPFVNLFCL